jgi:hypothetical protein
MFPEASEQETVRFRIRKEGFFVLARKSRDCAEAYFMYAAQAKPQIDAARAENNPFWTETNSIAAT